MYSTPARAAGGEMRKLIVIAAVVVGVWFGLHRGGGHGFSSIGAAISGDVSEEELRRLAAGVHSGEVVIYTTTECQYCAQAKAWMKQYGFAFTECDAEVSNQCAQELQELG